MTVILKYTYLKTMDWLKKKLRNLYYFFYDGKIVKLKGYKHLEKSSWILDKNFGRAYYTGAYEPEICEFLLKNLKKNSVFVDVGAHAGYFSLFASKLCENGSVYSFEPSDSNYRYVLKIKNLNNVSNLKIFNVGVGEKQGVLFFSQGKTSSTGKINDNGDVKVEIVALDKILEDVAKIDLMKIDVEGFGAKVLAGAYNILEKKSPLILMEIHNTEEMNAAKDLEKYGYELYDFKTNEKLLNNNFQPFIIAKKD